MKNLYKLFMNKDYNRFMREFFDMSNEYYYDVDDAYRIFLKDMKEQFNYDGSKKNSTLDDLSLI